MIWLRRLQFYRRLLHAVLLINIVVVLSGLFSAVAFYTTKSALFHLAQQNHQRLVHLEDLDASLFLAATDSAFEKDSYRRRRHLEDLKEKLERWPDLNLGTLAVAPEAQGGLPMAFARSLRDRLAKERATVLEELRAANERIANVTVQLVVVAALTLLFGVLIPAWIFRRLMREVSNARRELETRVSHWVVQWAETYARHGEKPFQDAVFWLEVVTLSVESFAPQSKNPAMGFLAELAPLIRRELQKQRAPHQQTA